MTATSTEQTFDPRACAVAQAVCDVVRADMILLFGSRARGDYRPDSDIDLLLIPSDGPVGKTAYQKAHAAALRKAEEIYGCPIGVDLLEMTSDQFAYFRRARNHVAGRAVRDGVTANGERLDYGDEQPDNWPDIEQRLLNAREGLTDLEKGIEGGLSDRMVGFIAQQALENALKGYISALGDDYRLTHDLPELLATVRRHEAEVDTPAGEWLRWITQYAVRYRYVGATMEIQDRFELLSIVHDTVHSIIERIHEITGATPND